MKEHIKATGGKLFYVCGRCGATGTAEEMIVVSEEKFAMYGSAEQLAKPATARRGHVCGFLAIRCKVHPDAEKSSLRAMSRHLRRGGRVRL